MFQHVIEIPQTQEDHPIWNQQLRGATYCRTSTNQEEQNSSLENQIAYYTASFRVIPCGDSWLFARTKRRDCTRKTAQAIGRS